MKKNYIFLPILLFFALKDNNQIFASYTNRRPTNAIATSEDEQPEDNVIVNLTNLSNLIQQFDNSRSNSYGDKQKKLVESITSNKNIITSNKDSFTLVPPVIGFSYLSPAAQSSNNQPSSYSWTVTGETSEQKQKRLNSMVQEVDNIAKQLLQDGKSLPIDIYNWLQSENFTKSDIDEMNAYVLNSEKTTLYNKIQNCYTQKIATTTNAINSSPAAQSSSSNNLTNSNNTNNQPSGIEQAAYQKIIYKLCPKINAYFIQQAKTDAQNDRDTRNFHNHLAKFGLTTANRDKSPVNLGPIGEDINNFTNFNGYAFPAYENMIRNHLKRHLQTLYNNTFADHLRRLSETQCQQPSENKNKTSYDQQRNAWLKDQRAMNPQPKEQQQ